MKRKVGFRFAQAVMGLCFLLVVGRVDAAERVEQGADLQRFTPAVDPLGAFSVGSGEVLGPDGWAVGLHLNYARNPLVVREDGERVAATLENVLAAQLHGAIHVLSFLELGFGLPFIAYQDGNDARVQSIPMAAVGDLEIQPRFRLLTQERHAVGLAVTPGIRIPVGDDQAFAGGGQFTFTPRLSISHAFSRAFIAGDVWFNWRPEVEVLRYTTVGNELGLRLAGGVNVTDDTEAVLELDGALAFATRASGLEGVPLEAIAGIRHHLNERVALELGVGAGLFSAPGVPDFRIIAGVNFGSGLRRKGPQCELQGPDGVLQSVPTSGKDADGDGIDDACDLCPTDAGLSPHGCPDTDGDGILDKDDECPLEPGLAPHGCPDTDGDGILDRDDECPNEPGLEPHGCPDRDGDGVLDRDDLCPDEPGVAPHGCPDRDGDGVFDADDVCPDEPGVAPHGCPDADGDGVFDAEDKCPNDPGPAPHGCPDTDGDGIADHLDKCPFEKGPGTGGPNDDGCPVKKMTLVVVKREKIEILDMVYFDTDKDTIQKRSFPLLRQVAQTIKSNAYIKKIRVEGHTDDVGGHTHNVDLSQRRAESVKRFLVSEGVDADRLVPQGFAYDRPLVPNTNNKNRATNRRVEFNIVNEAEVEGEVE